MQTVSIIPIILIAIIISSCIIIMIIINICIIISATTSLILTITTTITCDDSLSNRTTASKCCLGLHVCKASAKKQVPKPPTRRAHNETEPSIRK